MCGVHQRGGGLSVDPRSPRLIEGKTENMTSYHWIIQHRGATVLSVSRYDSLEEAQAKCREIRDILPREAMSTQLTICSEVEEG